MGVSRAGDLHTSVHIWARQSVLDWIDWLPIFRVGRRGRHDSGDARVRRHGVRHPWVTDHDRYLAPITQSLDNIVTIGLGRDSLVTGPDSSAGTNTGLRGDT